MPGAFHLAQPGNITSGTSSLLENLAAIFMNLPGDEGRFPRRTAIDPGSN
jgi:hypothetical protein